MADISKITLLDGTEYNLKDSTARNSIPTAATSDPVMDGTVTVGSSTKYAREDHRHPSDTKKLDYDAALFTTNSFAPVEKKSLYISQINNAFFALNKRYSVSVINDGASVNDVAQFFDGNYEGGLIIAPGKTAIFTLDFSNGSGSKFAGYPYGYIYISFYNANIPASISGRVYNNFASQTVGWKDIAFEQISSSIFRANQAYYGLQTLEITMVGSGNTPYGYTRPTEIEFHATRPDPVEHSSIITKFCAQKLYYPLTAPSFIGDLTGNATSASKVNNHTVDADVPANAVFTDTQSNWNETNTSAASYIANKPALHTTYITSTAPSTSNTGDVWFIIE